MELQSQSTGVGWQSQEFFKCLKNLNGLTDVKTVPVNSHTHKEQILQLVQLVHQHRMDGVMLLILFLMQLLMVFAFGELEVYNMSQ